MKNYNGLSLIEVIIAMALLSVIAAPFLMAFNQSMITNIQTERISQATQIATNTLEYVKVEAKKGRKVNESDVDEALREAQSYYPVEKIQITQCDVVYSNTLTDGTALENDFYNVTVTISVKDTILTNPEHTVSLQRLVKINTP